MRAIFISTELTAIGTAIGNVCRIATGLAVAAFSSRAFAKSYEPFNLDGYTTTLEFQLPWDGPGAAVFNPAHLSETGTFDVRFGALRGVSSELLVAYHQAAVRLPGRLVAGLGYQGSPKLFLGESTTLCIVSGFGCSGKTNDIDRSGALYQRSVWQPMLSWSLDDLRGTGYILGIGASVPVRTFNAYGAVSSTSAGLDLGIQLRSPATPTHESFQAGLALINFVPAQATLPRDNPATEKEYYRLPWAADLSLGWRSPSGRFGLFGSLDSHHSPDPTEGPVDDDGVFGPDFFQTEIQDYGFEFRPIPALGVTLERTWQGHVILGGNARIPFGNRYVFGIESGVTHDKLFKSLDKGHGILWSFALNVSM